MDLPAAVSEGTLWVTAPAAEVPAAQAAKAILDRVETGLDARVAEPVEVRIDYVGPLEITLRLDEGRVCEQPPGLGVACESDNSEPFQADSSGPYLSNSSSRCQNGCVKLAIHSRECELRK